MFKEDIDRPLLSSEELKDNDLAVESAPVPVADLVESIKADVARVLSGDSADPALANNRDQIIDLAESTIGELDTLVNEGNTVVDAEPSTQPLRIELNRWRNWEFAQWSGNGAIERLLKGEITIDELVGTELSPEFEALTHQIRPLKIEVDSLFALTEEGELHYQVTPSIGNEHSVSTSFVDPPEGVKLFDVHNHPINGARTYPFFSNPDFKGILCNPSKLSPWSYLARTVVFSDGVAIVVATPETRRIVEEMSGDDDESYWSRRYMLDQSLRDSAIWPEPEEDAARQQYNIDVCREFGMGLFLVPKGERKIQALYVPEQTSS
ncbi:hypothetical protein KBD09_00740 [Candidatus Woesebacteria bacterium]|nr:hypothetical protein [Candidatus Woesebacteria bacterium]